MSNEKLRIELKIRAVKAELAMLRQSLDFFEKEIEGIEEEAGEMIEISALPHYINMRKLEMQIAMEAAQ